MSSLQRGPFYKACLCHFPHSLFLLWWVSSAYTETCGRVTCRQYADSTGRSNSLTWHDSKNKTGFVNEDHCSQQSNISRSFKHPRVNQTLIECSPHSSVRTIETVMCFYFAHNLKTATTQSRVRSTVKNKQPTGGMEGWTVHSSLLHQVPNGLQLRHDLILLFLGHRLHAGGTKEKRLFSQGLWLS